MPRISEFYDAGKCLSGRLGIKQTERVQNWIIARRIELQDNWQRALQGETLVWVEPLKTKR